jgi:ribosomal protein L31
MDVWMASYNKALKEHSQLLNHIGPGTIVTEEEKVRRYNEKFPKKNGKSRLIGEYTIKGWEMEIGGNTCHLCGEKVLFASDQSTFKKKHVLSEKHMVYQCGTQVFDTTHRYYDDRMPERKDRHIHCECLHCS